MVPDFGSKNKVQRFEDAFKDPRLEHIVARVSSNPGLMKVHEDYWLQALTERS